MKYVIPVDVSVKRTYRCYVEAEELATNEEITALVKAQIESNPDDSLYLPPDYEEFYPTEFLGLEDIERDGMFSVDERDEISSILSDIDQNQ